MNLKKTWKNKLIAIAMIGVGAIPAAIYNDGTVLVFMLMLGIPLFLTKENVIY